MKKILYSIICLTLIFSLAACKRKNDAKNLQIVSSKDNVYVIKYCQSELEFGDIYITIEDEKLTNFYTTNNDDYKLSTYQLLIGDYSASLNVTEEEDGKNTKTTFTLINPLKLITSTDDDGYETPNENDIQITVKFIDKNTDNEDVSEDDLLEDSYISITTDATDLIEFIRNKELKVKSE